MSAIVNPWVRSVHAGARLLALSLLTNAALAQELLPPIGDFYTMGDPARPAFLSDGTLIVGGSFTRVGATSITNLARFRGDGVLDGNWNPAPDSLPRAVLALSNGDFYVSGEFTRINGENRRGLVRFLGGDPPQLDSGYVPGIPANALSVDALALRSDGTLYASYCVSAGTFPCSVVRLAANGTLIESFALGANSLVLGLTLSTDESDLFVVGFFTAVNGETLLTRGNLAKVDALSGALDATWVPFPTGTGRVRVLLTDGPDHVLVGGQIPGGSEGLARIAVDDATVNLGWGPDFGPLATHLVSDLKRFPNNDLLVVGDFNSVNAAPRPSGLARLAPDGTAMPGWGDGAPTGGVTSNSVVISATGVAVVPRYAHPAQPESVLYALDPADGSDSGLLVDARFSSRGAFQSLLVQPGSGRILAGGPQLREFDGRLSHAVVALQPDLTADLAWTSALGSQVAMGGAIKIAASANDLFLGGIGFGTRGERIRGFWRLNGNNGGSTAWEPRASVAVGVGLEAPSALALDPVGGYIYAFGLNFDSNNAQLPGRPLPRFALSDGLLDSTWLPSITGSTTDPSLWVHGGFLYVAGSMNVRDTNNDLVPSFARIALNGNGRADPAFRPFAATTPIRTLVVANGYAYLGGLNQLLRVDLASGLIDPQWSSLPPNFGSIQQLSVSADGEVYLAGALNLGCGGRAVSAARVQPGGNLDPSWQVRAETTTGAFANAATVLGLSQGRALLGGFFSSIDGQPRDGLAAVGPSDTLFTDGVGDPGCVGL